MDLRKTIQLVTQSLYNKRRRLYQGVVPCAKSADIHPELTLEQIQNPPDNRRGVLRSVGSRYGRLQVIWVSLRAL